jgi:RHS repeat-associated protein
MQQNYIKYNAKTVSKSTSSFTGKERDSETGFSYFGARYYDSDLMTGWLSVDPMADKYPGLSPYAYCGWNPVKLVDPNGEEIYYRELNAEYIAEYIYKKDNNGNYNFFNKNTGEIYNGNSSQFVEDLISALGTLKSKNHGNRLVSHFEGSAKKDVYISRGNVNVSENNCIGLTNDPKLPIPVASSAQEEIQTMLPEMFVSLAHEMAHVRDYYNDFNSKSEEIKEKRAMFTENLVRREHWIRQRTYSGLKGMEVDFDSYPAVTFPPLFLPMLINKYLKI